MCYVQLQCTFSNVCVCVCVYVCVCARVYVYIYIYIYIYVYVCIYIYIYIYIYYLFVSPAFITCSQNAVNLLHFITKNYVNEMHNEL